MKFSICILFAILANIFSNISLGLNLSAILNSPLCRSLKKIKNITDIYVMPNEIYYVEINNFFEGSLIDIVYNNTSSDFVSYDPGYYLIKANADNDTDSEKNYPFLIPINGSDSFVFAYTTRDYKICETFLEMDSQSNIFMPKCLKLNSQEFSIPLFKGLVCNSSFYFSNFSNPESKDIYISLLCSENQNDESYFYRFTSLFYNNKISIITYYSQFRFNLINSNSLIRSIPSLNILAIANKLNEKDPCYSFIDLINLNFTYLKNGFFSDPFITIDKETTQIEQLCFNDFHLDLWNNNLILIFPLETNFVNYLLIDLNTCSIFQKYQVPIQIQPGIMYSYSEELLYIASTNTTLNEISGLRVTGDSIYLSSLIERECEYLSNATLIDFVKTKDFFVLLMSHVFMNIKTYFIRVFYDNEKGRVIHIYDIPLLDSEWNRLIVYDDPAFNIIIVNSNKYNHIYKLSRPAFIINTQKYMNSESSTININFFVHDIYSTFSLNETFLIQIKKDYKPALIQNITLISEINCFYNLSCPVNLERRIKGYYETLNFKNRSEDINDYNIIIDQKLRENITYIWSYKSNYTYSMLHREFLVFDDYNSILPKAFLIINESTSSASDYYCLFNSDEVNNRNCPQKIIHSNFSGTSLLQYHNYIFRLFWSSNEDNFDPFLEIFILLNNNLNINLIKTGYLTNMRIEYYIVDIDFSEKLNRIYFLYHNYFLNDQNRSGILYYSLNTILIDIQNEFIFMKEIGINETNRPRWMNIVLSYGYIIFENGSIWIMNLDNDEMIIINNPEIPKKVFDVDANSNTKNMIIITTFPFKFLLYKLNSSNSIEFVKALSTNHYYSLGASIQTGSYCAFEKEEFGNFYAILWIDLLFNYILDIYDLTQSTFDSLYLSVNLNEFNSTSEKIIGIKCLYNGVMIISENKFKILRIDQNNGGHNSQFNDLYLRLKYTGNKTNEFNETLALIFKSELYEDISFNISINMLPSNQIIKCLNKLNPLNSSQCIGNNEYIDNPTQEIPLPKIFKGYNISYQIINFNSHLKVKYISYGLGSISNFSIDNGNLLKGFYLLSDQIYMLIEEAKINKTFIRSFRMNLLSMNESNQNYIQLSKFYQDLHIDMENQRIIYFTQFMIKKIEIIFYVTKETKISIDSNQFYYCIRMNEKCDRTKVEKLNEFYFLSNVNCEYKEGIQNILCTIYTEVDTIFLIISPLVSNWNSYKSIQMTPLLEVSQVLIPNFQGIVTEAHLSNLTQIFYVLSSTNQLFSVCYLNLNYPNKIQIDYIYKGSFTIDPLSSINSCNSFSLFNLDENKDRIYLVINNNLLFKITIFYDVDNNSKINNNFNFKNISINVLPLAWADNYCVSLVSDGQFLAILFKNLIFTDEYEIKIVKVEADIKISEGIEIISHTFQASIIPEFMQIKANLFQNKNLLGIKIDTNVFGYLEFNFNPSFLITYSGIEDKIPLEIVAKNEIFFKKQNNVEKFSFLSSNYTYSIPTIKISYGSWISLIIVIITLFFIVGELYLMNIAVSFLDFFFLKHNFLKDNNDKIRRENEIMGYQYQINSEFSSSNLSFMNNMKFIHQSEILQDIDSEISLQKN